LLSARLCAEYEIGAEEEDEESSEEELLEEEERESQKEEEVKRVEKLVVVCQPIDSVWEGRMAAVLVLTPEVKIWNGSGSLFSCLISNPKFKRKPRIENN
jgi:hypothetical protein